MSTSTLHPRPEQVAELTRGVTLPLAPLPNSLLQSIAQTLSFAWADLSLRRGPLLIEGAEPEISTLLVSRLNNLILEDPIWGMLIANVTPGTEALNYDGRHIGKRPDISLHFTHGHRSFPLVVECKLIDTPSKKTVALYCTEGLERFLVGDYAWGRREAFMLAYVRDGSTIICSLKPFLEKSQFRKPDPWLTEQMPVVTGGTGGDLAQSRHGRRFAYIHQVPDQPGPISIWHLWLPTPPPG